MKDKNRIKRECLQVTFKRADFLYMINNNPPISTPKGKVDQLKNDEDKWIESKHMKGYSLSLVIEGMRVTSTVIFYSTPLRTATI